MTLSELRRRSVYSDPPTQLNSIRRRVELCRYKRALKNHRRTTTEKVQCSVLQIYFLTYYTEWIILPSIYVFAFSFYYFLFATKKLSYR